MQRSLGTFLLTMFGVGETVGAGIFIVLSQSVRQAGPAVVISFVIASVAAGLAAVCYAEMASALPVSGSAYSYCYATMGELAAMGVAACLLLDSASGASNLPAIVLVAMCAVPLIRGVNQSARANAVMVAINRLGHQRGRRHNLLRLHRH